MPISTADLCDQYENQIQAGQVQIAQPLFSHYGRLKNFSGPIETIQCQDDNSMVGELLRGKGGGRVLVVDGGASINRSLLGDQLAQSGVDNGWAGVVINGCVRDVAELAGIPLGVLALASTPRKTEKAGGGEVGVPVSFAGVSFRPEYYVYADETGLLVSEFKL